MQKVGPSPWLILLLGLSQTIYYSALYYLFPAFIPYVSSHFPWSTLEYTTALSVILLTSGIAAPFMGRWVDRNRGMVMLGLAGLVGGLSLWVLPFCRNPLELYLLSALVGVSLSMGTYDVCFAHLARRYGQDAGRAISWITIMAGFAGTVTFPSVRVLTVSWGAEGVFFSFGAAAFLMGGFLLWRGILDQGGPVPEALGSRPESADRLNTHHFQLLALLVAAKAGVAAMVTGLQVQFIPLMLSLEFTMDTATWLAAGFGPMQVLGRVLYLTLLGSRSHSPLRAALMAHLLLVGGSLLLGGVQFFSPLVLLFLLVHGTAAGSLSILSPRVNLELFSRSHVGKAGGMLGLVSQITASAAPALSALAVLNWGVQFLPVVFVLLTLPAAGFFALGKKLGQNRIIPPKPKRRTPSKYFTRER